MSKNIVIKVKLPKQQDKKPKAAKRGKRGRTGDCGPKGDVGFPGPQGIMGMTGAEGIQGKDGAPGRVDANTLLDVIETDERVQAAIKLLVSRKPAKKSTSTATP